MLNMGNCGLERLHGSSRRHSFWVAEMGLHPRLNSRLQTASTGCRACGYEWPGKGFLEDAGEQAGSPATHRMVQVEGREEKKTGRKVWTTCVSRNTVGQFTLSWGFKARTEGHTAKPDWGKSCPQEVNIFLGNIRLWANKWQDKDCILSVLISMLEKTEMTAILKKKHRETKAGPDLCLTTY